VLSAVGSTVIALDSGRPVEHYKRRGGLLALIISGGPFRLWSRHLDGEANACRAYSSTGERGGSRSSSRPQIHHRKSHQHRATTLGSMPAETTARLPMWRRRRRRGLGIRCDMLRGLRGRPSMTRKWFRLFVTSEDWQTDWD
jgi:hypothetical protein